MTLYVKRSTDSKAEGPFTAKQVRKMLRQKRIELDALVLINSDEESQDATKAATGQWTRVADVPDFNQLKDERKYLLLIAAIVAFLILVPLALLVKPALWLNQIH